MNPQKRFVDSSGNLYEMTGTVRVEHPTGMLLAIVVSWLIVGGFCFAAGWNLQAKSEPTPTGPVLPPGPVGAPEFTPTGAIDPLEPVGAPELGPGVIERPLPPDVPAFPSPDLSE